MKNLAHSASFQVCCPNVAPRLGTKQLGGRTRLHRILLDWLGKTNAISWSRACIDSVLFATKKGAGDQAESDRGRLGSKRHLLVDSNGIPLSLLLKPAIATIASFSGR
ncbi:hypothetical protein [Geminicoccus harenae]|uniref:hypothetical protein n=1 Tax=Geminicoccus harenae TaxID=2498453 RepID=UPI00168B04F7|nr:hypothetical protein [Geminicoccus harenae]